MNSNFDKNEALEKAAKLPFSGALLAVFCFGVHKLYEPADESLLTGGIGKIEISKEDALTELELVIGYCNSSEASQWSLAVREIAIPLSDGWSPTKLTSGYLSSLPDERLLLVFTTAGSFSGKTGFAVGDNLELSFVRDRFYWPLKGRAGQPLDVVEEVLSRDKQAALDVLLGPDLEARITTSELTMNENGISTISGSFGSNSGRTYNFTTSRISFRKSDSEYLHSYKGKVWADSQTGELPLWNINFSPDRAQAVFEDLF